MVGMGRRSHTQRLDLWMNGLAVGYWEKSGGSEQLVFRSADSRTKSV